MSVHPQDCLLSIRKLRKEFGGLLALNNVSFDVFSGEIVGLIGPNGAGKTTLFNLVTGFHEAEGGELHLNGERIDELKPHEIVERGVVRTFQNVQVFNNMTVLENVMVGLHRHGRSGILAAALRAPATLREEEVCRRDALHYLELVGLAERSSHPANSLPFGQQRLMEIGRALAVRPTLLLLDEPAAGLTRNETEALNDLIRRLRQDGITILLVEHDMELVMDIADRVVVLHFGTKIAEGTPDEVQNNYAVIQAYLGVDWQEDKLLSNLQPDVKRKMEVGDA